MRFAQASQGRGQRLPRIGRVLCGSVIGNLSQFLYPIPRPERTLSKSVGKVLARPAEIETSRERVPMMNETPIRVMGVRYGSGPMLKRVKASVIAGASGPEAEELFKKGMDLLFRIAKKLRGENTNEGIEA